MLQQLSSSYVMLVHIRFCTSVYGKCQGHTTKQPTSPNLVSSDSRQIVKLDASLRNLEGQYGPSNVTSKSIALAVEQAAANDRSDKTCGVRNSTAIVMCWEWIGTVTELRFQIETAISTDPRPTSFDSKGAFIFHHTLTEGPENTSRVVGRAQGFIIPLEHFAHSAFNIIYLTFDMSEYSGSLNIQANQVHDKGREELTVVGGMGVFAFTRGLAIFS
ncbi:hypothetical protein IFM89_039477 [Coptis chinensis]|uniref:Dirigent protein n=1 Tax=Coptis chinensis TaxID=261450 RepID=A0A835IKB3_9MAGN|nr:hypothetical protein IFM89_039477 [Coptis chinensis]